MVKVFKYILWWIRKNIGEHYLLRMPLIKALKVWKKDAGVAVKACSHITGSGFYAKRTNSTHGLLGRRAKQLWRKAAMVVPAMFNFLPERIMSQKELMYNTLYDLGEGSLFAVDKEDVDNKTMWKRSRQEIPLIYVGHMESWRKVLYIKWQYLFREEGISKCLQK